MTNFEAMFFCANLPFDTVANEKGKSLNQQIATIQMTVMLFSFSTLANKNIMGI